MKQLPSESRQEPAKVLGTVRKAGVCDPWHQNSINKRQGIPLAKYAGLLTMNPCVSENQVWFPTQVPHSPPPPTCPDIALEPWALLGMTMKIPSNSKGLCCPQYIASPGLWANLEPVDLESLVEHSLRGSPTKELRSFLSLKWEHRHTGERK